MKFFTAIIILIFATLASTVPIVEKLNIPKIVDDCAEEFNIKVSEFEKVIKEHLRLPYNNSTGHCFVKCCLEKLGLFDDKNGFNVEILQQKIAMQRHPSKDDALYMPMVVKCAKNADQGANGCEHAYRIAACFVNEVTENFLKSNPELIYSKECAEELEIPFSELKHYEVSFNLTDSNPKLHCFSKCLHEKMGDLEKNNVFNVQHIYNKYVESEQDPSGELRGKIEKCAKDHHQGANDCERAFNGILCINDAFKQLKPQEVITPTPQANTSDINVNEK